MFYCRIIRKKEDVIKTTEMNYSAEISQLQERNDRLEIHLSGLKDDLQEAKELNTSLSYEIQNSSTEGADDSGMELSELIIVNKHLKDKNDELMMKLQSFANIEDDLDIDGSQHVLNLKTSLILPGPQPQAESLKQECEYNMPRLSALC